MSREIDTSKPGSLSLEDRVYLADRGRLPEGAKMPTSKELAKLRKEANPPADETVAENDGAEVEDDEEGSEYDDMSVEELKDELAERDLPVSGNKADLIDRLVEDDEA